MANSIEFAKNYTGILDEVYQRAAVSRCLNSGGRMVRAGRNAKEILIPKISVTGLGDYTRNVGYRTGSITYEYETHSFGYDRAIRLFADVMDVDEKCKASHFSSYAKQMVMRSSWQRRRPACVSAARNFA